MRICCSVLFAALFLACDLHLFSEQQKIQSASEKKVFPIQKNWLLGRLVYKKDPRFVRIAKPYTMRSGLYLHRDTYTAFTKMHAAAKQDGISLVILSAARNFWYQKRLWEAKWKGELKTEKRKLSQLLPFQRVREILKYSAMPTTSRHHWGSDIDINALDNGYFQKGAGLRIYQWLQHHARRFGFCQVYTAKGKERPYGYAEERWHWSYLPLATPLQSAYLKQIRYADIKDFSGANFASAFKVIEHYVGGVAPDCLRSEG